MKKECECGSILEKAMTDFKGTKEIPCWRCPKCGTEFFDAEQVEVLDKHLTEIRNQQLNNSLEDDEEEEEKEKKNIKDDKSSMIK